MIFLKTPSLTLPLHIFWAVMAKIRVSDEEEKQNVVSSLSLVDLVWGRLRLGKGGEKGVTEERKARRVWWELCRENASFGGD